jgi:hypothetical protein
VCIYLAYGIDLLISIEQHNQTPCQATRNWCRNFESPPREHEASTEWYAVGLLLYTN